MGSDDQSTETTGVDESTEAFASRIISDIYMTGLSTLDNPNSDLASHVAMVLGAVATAIKDADPSNIDLEAGVASLPHKCDTHIEAALFMLAISARQQGMTALQVIGTIPGAIRATLRSHLT